MATNYVGKRFRACVRLAEPVGPVDIGEEFTVTPAMVAVVETAIGPYVLVDFGSLLATGAIEPVSVSAGPRDRPAEKPAGGGVDGG